jgi:tetratricopeptide (TPR) repeat protein
VSVIGWGLGPWYSTYVYGTSGYYNPYYAGIAATTTVPYDYSQPVTVNYFAQPAGDSSGGQAPASSTPTDAAQAQFDQGLELFKAGKYREALPQFDAALRLMPNDPVVHEVRALNLFALGQYQQAAASLNALLATAPGMDWTTLSGLYGNLDDYTQQLRALENHCRANRTDASAAFVLAYHYLVNGHQDAAINALKVVVQQQPKDVVAKRMLESLTAPEDAETPPPEPAEPAADGPETDLVGTWQAKAGDSTIELTITEDSQFTWKATQKGQPPVQIEGTLTAGSDTLILESETQGSMIGRVKSLSPDKWQFSIAGDTSNDAQLTFERTK